MTLTSYFLYLHHEGFITVMPPLLVASLITDSDTERVDGTC